MKDKIITTNNLYPIKDKDCFIIPVGVEFFVNSISQEGVVHLITLKYFGGKQRCIKIDINLFDRIFWKD